MEKVKLLGAKCYLHFGRYPNNTVAIQAYKTTNGELWEVPTINWEQNFEGHSYIKDFLFPRLVIDKRHYKKNIYKELSEAGVIVNDFYLAGTQGEIQAAQLTEKWQKIAIKQLKIKIGEAIYSAYTILCFHNKAVPAIELLYKYAKNELKFNEPRSLKFAKREAINFHDNQLRHSDRFNLWFFLNYVSDNNAGFVNINEVREIAKSHFKQHQASVEKLRGVLSVYALEELNLFAALKRNLFLEKTTPAFENLNDIDSNKRKRFFLWYYINYIQKSEDDTDF